MRCVPVLVLRASSTVHQVRRQVRAVPADADVVVIRECDGDVSYYILRAGRLSDQLTGAAGEDVVADAINLDDVRPARAEQLDSEISAGSVALLGRDVLGVMVGDGLEKSMHLPTWGSGPHGAAIGPGSSPSFAPPDLSGDEARSAAASDRALFRAYPDVDAPGHVGAGQRFTVSVGFSRTAPPTMLVPGPPILVMAGRHVEFLIQIAGFGFSFPDGTQRTVTVDREKPESGRVDFTVLADQTSVACQRFLEVSYEFEGVVVGRAWAQIATMAGATGGVSDRAVLGGSDVLLPESSGDAPHLSVDIISRGGSDTLCWVFHCPCPDIQRPSEVTTTLNDDSAQSFALQLMRQVPDVVHLVTDTMRGIGRQISDAMPGEFWAMLEKTWQLANRDGQRPRMQITTNDPWIPWELAWVDGDLLSEPGLLGDCPDGAPLGELWQIGRWMTPIHRLPQSPPQHSIDVSKMAVVIGDYAGTAVKELPDAVKEGEELAKTYGAMPVDVSVDAMAQLLHCQLTRDGAKFEPTAIHFAGHGQANVADPEFTGLILGGGYTLDPLAVRGCRAIREQRPFVFLNACEAGAGGETLMALGGLVGAFLSEGATGFVAPLWRVDDAEAHDIAVEFYQRTIGGNQTVGEAMSAIRARFRAGKGSTTALAYVFFGDPALRLQR